MDTPLKTDKIMRTKTTEQVLGVYYCLLDSKPDFNVLLLGGKPVGFANDVVQPASSNSSQKYSHYIH